LYYGLLINQKLHEEAETKVELARIRLQDVESALKAGKTIDVNKSGLLANLADEEQYLLKTEIQAEDYWGDFRTLTGITEEKIKLENVEFEPIAGLAEEDLSTRVIHNNDLEMAVLGKTKAEHGVKAANWGYLPDIGFIAGYTYQKGNRIYPERNPFIGANFKWNLQDVFLNRELVHQRQSQLLQARELVIQTDKQLKSDIEKTERKLNQARALIVVAHKAVKYREEELAIQQGKLANGLNTLSEVLNTKALLAKAQADLLASQLNYLITCSELKTLCTE
jgi:outer membrane protein TolC